MPELNVGIVDLLGISVVGAILTYVVELVKGKWGAEGNTAKGIVLALSVVVGVLYVWLRSTPAYLTILAVLGSASFVYGFFVKK